MNEKIKLHLANRRLRLDMVMESNQVIGPAVTWPQLSNEVKAHRAINLHSSGETAAGLASDKNPLQRRTRTPGSSLCTGSYGVKGFRVLLSPGLEKLFCHIHKTKDSFVKQKPY
jgi:hypothetical protein